MSEYIITNEQLNWFLERMDETDVIPSAIVLTHLKPIVRCKDCKYLIAHGAGCSYWDNCDIQSVNGFCAWGEREDGDAR